MPSERPGCGQVNGVRAGRGAHHAGRPREFKVFELVLRHDSIAHAAEVQRRRDVRVIILRPNRVALLQRPRVGGARDARGKARHRLGRRHAAVRARHLRDLRDRWLTRARLQRSPRR